MCGHFLERKKNTLNNQHNNPLVLKECAWKMFSPAENVPFKIKRLHNV